MRVYLRQRKSPHRARDLRDKLQRSGADGHLLQCTPEKLFEVSAATRVPVTKIVLSQTQQGGGVDGGVLSLPNCFVS